MKRTTTAVLRLGSLAAVGALAAACGGSGTGGTTASSSGAAAPALEGRGDITFVTGKDTSNNMQKLVGEWNGAHPTEQVRIVELPESADAQRQQLVQNAQVKSNAYTVVNLDVVWTAEFAANRWIVELPRDQFELDKFLKPAVATAEYRDKLYAVPVYSDGGLLYYRKDLLTKAGVTAPPGTWDEMTADCAKVKALPEGASLGCYAGQFEKYEGLTVNFDEAVHSAGGAIVDAAGKPTVDTPQAKAGLDRLVDSFKSGTIPQKAVTYKEEESRRAFQAGELVFQRQWPYQWALANKTDGSSTVAGKFDVAPLPGVTAGGVSSLGGHNFAISAFAEHKATALDFIKFFTTEQAERSNLLATSQAPTRADLYDDQELVKQFPYLPTLKASILGAQPRPKAVRYGDVTTAIQESAYAALTGTKDSATALKELQAKLQDLLK